MYNMRVNVLYNFSHLMQFEIETEPQYIKV